METNAPINQLLQAEIVLSSPQFKLLKNIYVVYSTGELEVAILNILSGNCGIIFDFSLNSKNRNHKLLQICLSTEDYLYFAMSKKFHRFIRLLTLYTFRQIISLNSYGFSMLRVFAQDFFKVRFIRDAFEARPMNCYKNFKRLLCEKRLEHLYPNAEKILVKDSQNEFLDRIKKFLKAKKNIDKKFGCLLIGKSMKRTPSGPIHKANLYNFLVEKFGNVALIPHPRESIDEIEMARDCGLIILDSLIYFSPIHSDVIFVLGGSSGTILNKLNTKFYYIFFPDEFIYHGNKKGLHGGKSIESFYSIKEMKKFDFNISKLHE